MALTASPYARRPAAQRRRALRALTAVVVMLVISALTLDASDASRRPFRALWCPHRAEPASGRGSADRNPRCRSRSSSSDIATATATRRTPGTTGATPAADPANPTALPAANRATATAPAGGSDGAGAAGTVATAPMSDGTGAAPDVSGPGATGAATAAYPGPTATATPSTGTGAPSSGTGTGAAVSSTGAPSSGTGSSPVGTTTPPTRAGTGTGAPATTSRTPSTVAPATGGTAPAAGVYQANLALIRAQTVRNRNQDASPDRATPSAQLDLARHLGPRTDYLNNPAGNPEQDFPVAEGGQFRTACEFSHFAYDDPIVHPGQPGASHLHIYFGNTDTNAFSTADSLLNSGASTCNGGELNRTAYWAPALFDDRGNARIPERIVVYYKGEGLANGRAEVAPAGAAMVSKANVNLIDNGRGGAIGKFSFTCSDNYSGPSQPASNTMLACDGNAYRNAYGADDPHMVLEMNIKFPQCWNGQDPTNPANFSLPTDGGWYFSNCTGSFNHTLVNLEYFIDYPVDQGENTAGWYLSSDVDPATGTLNGRTPGATVHADWWNGWNHQVNQLWIDNCVNHRTDQPSGCGFGYLTDGGPDGDHPLPGPALRYRQQWTGTDKVPVAQLHNQLCPGTGPLATPAAGAYCHPAPTLLRAARFAGGGSSGGATIFCSIPPPGSGTGPEPRPTTPLRYS